MTTVRLSSLRLGLLLGIAACGSAAPPARGRVTASGPALERWTVDTVPSLVIEASESAMFSSISGAAMLGDGRVLVTDQLVPAIWVFGANGAFERLIARDGDGPQEVRFPAIRQRLSGDRLLISDRSRLRVLEASLTFSRTLGPPGAVSGSWWRPIGVLADGASIAIDTKLLPFDRGEPGKIDSMRAAIVRFTDDFSVRDTIAVLTDGTDWVTVAIGDGFGRPVQHFGWRLNVATDGTWIYATQGRAGRVIRYSMDGTGVDTIASWRAMPKPVTEEDRARVRHALKAIRAVPDTYAPTMFAATRPVIGRPLLDRDGNVWAIGYADVRGISPDSAYVFSAEGVHLADVAFPPGFTPLEIGRDYMLGRELDDDDVPRVVRYSLRKKLPSGSLAQ
jgi:hypothetical protein